MDQYARDLRACRRVVRLLLTSTRRTRTTFEKGYSAFYRLTTARGSSPKKVIAEIIAAAISVLPRWTARFVDSSEDALLLEFTECVENLVSVAMYPDRAEKGLRASLLLEWEAFVARRHHAAHIIERAWFQAMYNPDLAYCNKRMQRMKLMGHWRN